nr:unnamed protein product [Callosobruchus chinensis]
MALLVPNTSGHIHSHLTRSLERILEEANQSGELKLSNRKLKDFPKASEKYNLSDTVIADLSKNRFSELPEEVLHFQFLERLHCYHNSIRYIPDMVGNLQCLNFLDLSRNQLTTLPRELCHLPIQILLVSNNQLTSLPDELCRMQQLAELDASCNRLTHLPPRMGELHNLRSLLLRGNLLLAVPVELTQLQLVRLDLRGNRIAQLPLETRRMAEQLVDLFLDDNPLTVPPPTVCRRGRVHVFKYLEMEASKRGATPSAGVANAVTGGTLGRRQRRSNNGGGGASPLLATAAPGDRLRKNRQNADSGYSTASDGWAQEIAQQVKTIDQTSQSTLSTPSTISPAPECTMYDEDVPKTNSNSFSSDFDKLDGIKNRDLNSVRLSPCPDSTLTNSNGIDDKKPLHQIQTYREYKEALKQQRAQDVPSIYRSKDGEQHSYKTEPNTPTHHAAEPRTLATSKSDPTPLNSAFGSPRTIFDDTTVTKKPVQKVIPSRTYSPSPTSHHLPAHVNGTAEAKVPPTYVKPRSPIHNSTSTGSMGHDRIPNGKGGCVQLPTTPKGTGGPVKLGVAKTISWDREVMGQGKPPDKMSFTMRREIDKAKEESELINQLRSIIETRLKMVLPEDLAPALTDGVVLCHLANHIRPRSVASIHVPSPAVPKLTMARCRRNVDNFLEACRKIGVDEGEAWCRWRSLCRNCSGSTHQSLRYTRYPSRLWFKITIMHPKCDLFFRRTRYSSYMSNKTK